MPIFHLLYETAFIFTLKNEWLAYKILEQIKSFDGLAIVLEYLINHFVSFVF